MTNEGLLGGVQVEDVLPRGMSAQNRSGAAGARWQGFLRWAAVPVSGGSLAAFRIILGTLIVVSVARFFYYDWVTEYFVKPRFFFKYPGFEWIPHPGALGVVGLFFGVGLLGAAFAAGFYFRVVAPLLFLGFAWIQGLDATNYLNHYYLVTCLLFLSCFMPLGEVFGLDALRKKYTRQTLPQWMLWVLRFQIGCVYVFAAKAKFTTDWLVHGEPLGIWLSSRTQLPVLGRLFELPYVNLAFAWAGFLFDATIVGWLLWRRSRPVAYAVLMLFHFVTGLLFPIGMFPYIMTFLTLLFFAPDWPEQLGHRVGLSRHTRSSLEAARTEGMSASDRPLSGAAGWALAAYALFHVLMPLRQHVLGDNVLWDEQGMRFSWKVMVREKNASVAYTVEDAVTGRVTEVLPRDYLDQRQEREFATQPEMIAQLAKKIGEDATRVTGQPVKVRADALVSLNGRRPARLIDPTRDLMVARDPSWILPLPASEPKHLRGVR